MKTLILSALLLVLLTAGVSAQDATTDDYETGKNEFTVWGGFSPDSSTVFKGTGRTKDARFGIVAFRYSRRFNNSDAVNLKYTADFVPAAFLNYPDFEIPQVQIAVFPPPPPIAVRPTRYAFGVAPLGLQANFRPRKKVQPFLGASGGLLYFNKQTPNYVGTRFAFTADVGGGVEFKLKNKRSFTVGYKYYHISNGDRGIENPGFDNNVFYVGYTFFSK
jgi:opacity protein-like surface antigen